MKCFILSFFLSVAIFSIAQHEIKDRLQGTWEYSELRICKEWSLASFEYDQDSEFRFYKPFVHWIISGNNIYEIDYPCCLVKQLKFEIRDTLLIVRGDREYANECRYTFSFSADSLILDDVESGSRTTLLMDTLPETEVNELIKGKINPKCLYGDWEIPTGDVAVPFDELFVSYPWEMPETIHIDSSNIDEYWRKGVFYLPVDGVKKPFRVITISLYQNNFTVLPLKWSKPYFEKTPPIPDYNWYDQVWLRKKL